LLTTNNQWLGVRWRFMASVLPTYEEGNSYSCNQAYASRLGSNPCMVIGYKWTHVADVGSKSLAYWSSPTASDMEVLLEEFIRTWVFIFKVT
jgi:hypothetical protein